MSTENLLPRCCNEILETVNYEPNLNRRRMSLDFLTSILHYAGLAVSEIETYLDQRGIKNPDEPEATMYRTHCFTFTNVSCVSMDRAGLCPGKTKSCTKINSPSAYCQKMALKIQRKNAPCSVKGRKYGM